MTQIEETSVVRPRSSGDATCVNDQTGVDHGINRGHVVLTIAVIVLLLLVLLLGELR